MGVSGLRGPLVCAAQNAVAILGDSQTIACSGFVGCAPAEALTAALDRRFDRDGSTGDVDMPYVCPRCSSIMRILALIINPGEVKKILRYLVKIGCPPPGLDPDRAAPERVRGPAGLQHRAGRRRRRRSPLRQQGIATLKFIFE